MVNEGTNAAKSRLNSLTTRVSGIEDALLDLSTQISILKTTFAKVNARISSEMVAKKSSNTLTPEELFKDMFKGKDAVDVTEWFERDSANNPDRDNKDTEHNPAHNSKDKRYANS